MVVIRPSGSLVNLESIRLCLVLALFPQCPPTALPSCEVSELQLNLWWSGKRKLLFFFFTLILDVHSWFDFKGTLSESVQWVVEKKTHGKTHFCWMKLTFCQCLTLHIFSVRHLPYAYVVCWLKLFHFSCLIPSPLPLFAKAGVKWYWAMVLSHHHHHRCCCLPALHYWTCCSTATGETPGHSPRIRISCSRQAIFKLGSELF